jgi:DNA helicase II / ATP-dependent DNA helicase PcrA
MRDLFEGLNEDQIKAVNHINGPLLIFAGAGSGKTRVIVHRVANLINSGINPHRILCLTFTNKAAGEMKDRLAYMLGNSSSGLWAGTFHSFGAWMLRREANRTGYPQSFTIYDAADTRSLIGKCLKDLRIKTNKGTDSQIAWLISMAKDTLQDCRYFNLKLNFDPVPVIGLYEERKREYGAFDFGDLLKVPGQILNDFPDARKRYNETFPYILVDEYQDTNMAQYVMLMGLVSEDRNICVVGDDDQSIYGWRGADVGNILRFKEDFPEARVITLEKNYRSTEEILNAASSLISYNSRRAPKVLKPVKKETGGVTLKEYPDDDAEAANVSRSISRMTADGANPSDIAVFYRINAISRVIEENLVRYGIPYAVYGGIRFYERREIKDVLAYLRIIANPNDEDALLRVINNPGRGIGPKTFLSLKEFAAGKGFPNMLEGLKEAADAGAVKGKAAEGLKDFITQTGKINDASSILDVAGLIELTLDITGLRDDIKSEVDGEDRLTNLRELVASAYGSRDLQEFLAEKSLLSNTDRQEGDKVSVMTLHMSKGLEFDHVFILGLEEGILPHSRSMSEESDVEEERRLLYVGITRAKKQAHLSWARVRALYGRESFQYPSGFLAEIRSGL